MRVEAVSSLVRTRLRTLRLGQHLCLFYDHSYQQLMITAEYLALGLQRRERCLYVADESDLNGLRRILVAGGIDVTAELERGVLVLLTKHQAHLRGGRFDAEGMTAMLGRAVEDALQSGFTGLRAAGDMSWTLDEAPGTERVIEYEAMMNTFFPSVPALGLCLYDRRRVHPVVLEGALRTHPTALVGDTCCDDNPFYESPDVFFQRIDPRERFEWKLRQVTARVLAGAEQHPNLGV